MLFMERIRETETLAVIPAWWDRRFHWQRSDVRAHSLPMGPAGNTQCRIEGGAPFGEIAEKSPLR